MQTFLTIENEDLIFQSIKNPNDIKYEFIDDIGIFSQRIYLDFYSNEDKVKLNLKEAFKKKIVGNIKICIHLYCLNKINEILSNINSLYDIHISSDKDFLYIEIKEKGRTFCSEINGKNLNIQSKYNIEIYLSSVIEGSEFTSSQHFITNEKFVNVSEVIKVIETNPIINQQWKIQILVKDNYSNKTVNYINIYDFVEENKILFDEKSIEYNSKKNCLINKKIFYLEKETIKKLEADESILKIEFEKDMDGCNLYLTIRSRQGNIFDYNEYNCFKIYKNKVILDFNEMKNLYLKSGDNLDILIGDSITNAKFITIDKEFLNGLGYFALNDFLDGKLYVNGRNALSIYLKQSPKNTVNKVAVLGTCFSRNALNTNNYFNPEYKMYLECVLTQFHSRLDSLNSEKAPCELINQFSNHNEFSHIYRDMAKTFFEDLEASNAQFLIIDLYADALLKSLVLNNGSKITFNYLIKENNKLGEFVENWDQYQFITEEELLDNWTKSLHEFMEKVTKIIPESNIILNRGRLAEKFYENGELKEFKTISLIRRNNYIWEKLDNIFYMNYPNIQVIDLTEEDLYSSKKHPFGFSFSHYESEYYKKYFSELIKKMFLIKEKA